MSDWLFDERRGNSVSRHAVTQRNSSGGSPRQGLSVIKVDLECKVKETLWSVPENSAGQVKG